MKIRASLRCSAFALAAVAAGASADVVKDWNAFTLQLIKSNGTPPPKASRALAMASIAVQDAMNSIDRTHHGCFYNAPAGVGASREVAVSKAAHDVLQSLFPASSAAIADRLTSVTGNFGGNALSNGLAAGQGAAQACLSMRSTDGSATAQWNYTGSTEVGKWRPTPPANANGLLPGWGSLSRFATGSEAYTVGPPPALDTVEYAEALNEVQSLGKSDSSTRTSDQTAIAHFWADGGGTVTPPGHWNEIANKVADSLGYSPGERARLLAMVNMALADAGIAAWDVKYDYELWRPISAIREADLDGNDATEKDAAWSSLLGTPPFPAYVSGHSTFSAAAAEVIASVIGADGVTFTSDSDYGTSRTFHSLRAAAEEAGMSRIYGGIHFQFDNTVGLDLGQWIGSYVGQTQFQPVPEPASCLALLGALASLARRKKG